MIKTYDLIPSYYYDKSRDFQLLGRTYEVLFNYLKTEVDLIKENPLSSNSNIDLLLLLTKTLGFESKHNYNVRDLKSLCSAFIDILKYKGSLISIQETINILLNVQQINKDFNIVVDELDPYNLQIYLPNEITDLVLLEDIFNYILPAGFTYNFVYASFSEPTTTYISNDDKILSYKFNDTQLGQVTNPKENDIRPDRIKNDSYKSSSISYIGKVVGDINIK